MIENGYISFNIHHILFKKYTETMDDIICTHIHPSFIRRLSPNQSYRYQIVFRKTHQGCQCTYCNHKMITILGFTDHRIARHVYSWINRHPTKVIQRIHSMIETVPLILDQMNNMNINHYFPMKWLRKMARNSSMSNQPNTDSSLSSLNSLNELDSSIYAKMYCIYPTHEKWNIITDQLNLWNLTKFDFDMNYDVITDISVFIDVSVVKEYHHIFAWGVVY